MFAQVAQQDLKHETIMIKYLVLIIILNIGGLGEIGGSKLLKQQSDLQLKISDIDGSSVWLSACNKTVPWCLISIARATV